MSQTRSWWIACVATSAMRVELSRRKLPRASVDGEVITRPLGGTNPFPILNTPQKRRGFLHSWDHLVGV